MASSKTLLDALEIQEPPTHFEYNFTQDCCQRLLETCSCERPATETKLVVSTEGWRFLPLLAVKVDLLHPEGELDWGNIDLHRRKTSLLVHFPSLGEKSKVFFLSP